MSGSFFQDTFMQWSGVHMMTSFLGVLGRLHIFEIVALAGIIVVVAKGMQKRAFGGMFLHLLALAVVGLLFIYPSAEVAVGDLEIRAETLKAKAGYQAQSVAAQIQKQYGLSSQGAREYESAVEGVVAKSVGMSATKCPWGFLLGIEAIDGVIGACTEAIARDYYLFPFQVATARARGRYLQILASARYPYDDQVFQVFMAQCYYPAVAELSGRDTNDVKAFDVHPTAERFRPTYEKIIVGQESLRGLIDDADPDVGESPWAKEAAASALRTRMVLEQRRPFRYRWEEKDGIRMPVFDEPTCAEMAWGNTVSPCFNHEVFNGVQSGIVRQIRVDDTARAEFDQYVSRETAGLDEPLAEWWRERGMKKEEISYKTNFWGGKEEEKVVYGGLDSEVADAVSKAVGWLGWLVGSLSASAAARAIVGLGPWIQGFLLLVAYALFPFVVLRALIPEGWPVLLQYFGYVLWIKSWTLGWAVLHAFDRARGLFGGEAGSYYSLGLALSFLAVPAVTGGLLTLMMRGSTNLSFSMLAMGATGVSSAGMRTAGSVANKGSRVAGQAVSSAGKAAK